MKTKQIYCPNCKKTMLGQKQTVNHFLHLIVFIVLSFLTFGLGGLIYFFVWLILCAISASNPYLCPACGSPEEDFTEHRRSMETENEMDIRIRQEIRTKLLKEKEIEMRERIEKEMREERTQAED